jgi:hypothetical protein
MIIFEKVTHHLVGWDTVCSPLAQGGPGVRLNMGWSGVDG